MVKKGGARLLEIQNQSLKILVDLSEIGCSETAAREYFNSKGIYYDFSDGRYIVFQLSPLITDKQLKKLEKAISALKTLPKDYMEKQIVFGVRKMDFLAAENAKKILVPLENAAGAVAAESFGYMPPCTPLIVSGEIITDGIIQIIKNRTDTFGIHNGKVRIVNE